jgi:putative oxidoreductase
VRKVHLPNGPWAANGGYEYNVALVAALVAIAEDGPGSLSLDALLRMERRGPAWGAFALALGVVSSTLAIELGRRGGPAAAGAAPPAEPETSPYPGTAGDPVTSDDPASPGGTL